MGFLGDVASGALGGASGFLGGLFGGFSQRKRMKEQAASVERSKRELADWFNQRYNEDSTQRLDALRAITNAQDYLSAKNRQAAGTAAVMGGSDEQVAATKEASANALANATANIAATGEHRKDRIEDTFNSHNAAYDEELRKIKAGTPSGMDIAMGAVGGAASGLGRGLG